MKRIAIIPARGGSKRIKDKNIIDFCGKPIIGYPLEAAKSSGLFDVIHVSTDSDAIKGVVEDLGFPVDFMRDAALSGDMTDIFAVVKWALEQYRSRGESFDDVCLIYACAALIEAADLAAACKAYEDGGRKKPLMSVAEYPVPIEWAYERGDDGRLTPCQPEKFALRSQDLGAKYFDTGGFVFSPAAYMLDEKRHRERDYYSYVLPKHKAVDIDDEADLELARALMRGRREAA